MNNFAYFELKVQTQTRQERAQWPEEYLQHANPAQNSQGQERHTLFLHENVQTEAVSIQFEHFNANGSRFYSDFGH
jgi:hypothetical protein